MKRLFDVLLVLIILPFFLPILLVIWILIKLEDRGPALYWSKRVGTNNQIFLMPKFRSMKLNTPQVATHLLQNPDEFITKIGKFLRKSSLDEVPQLWSVLTGDMSFVGPRPALFNQDDLIELRTKCGVHLLRPGVTGWAQINGRDEIAIPLKVQFDEYYLKNQSLVFDIKIIFLTAFKVLKSDGVTH
ncbi:lipid carrier--UDP-N-acetylgalactosaminyltransferase [Bacteriovorax stolpii]|uniref:Lipid carrier--UDP-N-acetylgalactosaminyltransferase n=1 Tax=Bacteriovorax stolpii TaxID=960 RepID=A0A2K9NPZ9_BACTC|nr:sugar transferase [Bacteriovorax stolpii]AUN96844.1 lipid carrier--UDP-N-acetylgalactosaminyltransferase [Bacteriovorax stolpii]TDP53122.1 O-antigen biosynthesis protein WbqP [Bacteriovorax stolpii]